MSGLQDTQMWVSYQMKSGNNVPDSVSKNDLMKIIAFLFKQLDWIEDSEDSIDLESSPNFDPQVNNNTLQKGNESTRPFTSTSPGSDHQEKTGVGAENLASNVCELNELANEATENQHLRSSMDVFGAPNSVVQEGPSNGNLDFFRRESADSRTG